MIQIWKKEQNALIRIEKDEKYSWIDARNVSREELSYFETEFGIMSDHLQDIMDIDEQSRIEKEDEYTLIIVRLPIYDARFEVSYFTVPLGIILFPDRIITICQADSEVLQDLIKARIKDFSIQNKSAFILNLMGRAAMVYLRHLKEINRHTSIIERELQRSVKNNELIQLLSSEKSLVYFTTSLKSNEILLEKLQNSKLMRFKEEESELLEDVLTDNKQAIEMSNIYSDILSGMMDAFASVISNNLNIVMRRLTTISIVLMLSTLIVSAFSMNVPSPLENIQNSFWIIMVIASVMGFLAALILRDRSVKHKSKNKLKVGATSAIFKNRV